MKHLLLCITVLYLLIVGTSPAQGKNFKTDSRITAISKDSISVKVGHATHSYKITTQTLIQLDGAKAHHGDLKKGMHAEVTASQIDRNTAVAIEASSGS
jgi:hypothetical protein